MEHMEYNGRNVWNYLIPTNVGEISLVQYEAEGKELVDAFMGLYSNYRAEQVFAKISKKLLKGTL